jgi:hypothetical protein
MSVAASQSRAFMPPVAEELGIKREKVQPGFGRLHSLGEGGTVGLQ